MTEINKGLNFIQVAGLFVLLSLLSLAAIAMTGWVSLGVLVLGFSLMALTMAALHFVERRSDDE